VADLPVADLQKHPVNWEKWEKIYGIHLHPRWLLGQPAIMEIRLGAGALILSYPHLETPDDYWGNRLFLNILHYLSSKESRRHSNRAEFADPSQIHAHAPPPLNKCKNEKILTELQDILENTTELISFGERHLLWKRRNSWLLQWLRGIRGLEYGTLDYAVRFLAGKVEQAEMEISDSLLESLHELREEVIEFCRLSKQLLLEEKLAVQTGQLKKLGKINETVDGLRLEIFGSQMNHGGRCRKLFDLLDLLIFRILRQCRSEEISSSQ
jgi:hypothetical protein